MTLLSIFTLPETCDNLMTEIEQIDFIEIIVSSGTMQFLADLLQWPLERLIGALSAVLFFDLGGFAFIVVWLMAAALFFTVYLRGVNFRLFRHALRIASGRDKEPGAASGEVSPLQALFSAIAATVGLGSIAGISVAVAVGGPGATLWIVAAGLLGMASKFAEVTLSMQYRKIDADGKVFGGPIQYLQGGLRDLGFPRAGKYLATLFALFCLGGAIGGGNMFQSNQAVKMIAYEIPALAELKWLIALAFALLVGLVLFGSIRRIARVAEKISPLKGILYLLCAIIIVATHLDQFLPALKLMVTTAFTAEGAAGGFLGMLAIAFKRAMFANEAGLGSAPIAHAAARTAPVREGAVALLEPFFAAMIALLTGLIVTVTGAYQGASLEEGVLIAARAFASVGDWFTILLAVNVFLFAYSTTIGWSYYGEIAWSHLFGRRMISLYYILFCVASFAGGILHFGIVLDFSDLLILGMSLPNIIALYLLRRRVKSALEAYLRERSV
jgi:AGCS family alanine or glycine:cation symporter